MTLTSADGTKVAVRCTGDGSPIVLVHGAVGDSDTFALSRDSWPSGTRSGSTLAGVTAAAATGPITPTTARWKTSWSSSPAQAPVPTFSAIPVALSTHCWPPRRHPRCGHSCSTSCRYRPPRRRLHRWPHRRDGDSPRRRPSGPDVGSRSCRLPASSTRRGRPFRRWSRCGRGCGKAFASAGVPWRLWGVQIGDHGDPPGVQRV